MRRGGGKGGFGDAERRTPLLKPEVWRSAGCWGAVPGSPGRTREGSRAGWGAARHVPGPPSKNMIGTASGEPSGRFWRARGPSWSPLEGVGPSWSPLEGVLGRLGAVLREASLGPVRACVGASLGLLGSSWGLLGASWGPLGGLLGPPGGLLGRRAEFFGSCPLSWAPLGAFLGPL